MVLKSAVLVSSHESRLNNKAIIKFFDSKNSINIENLDEENENEYREE